MTTSRLRVYYGPESAAVAIAATEVREQTERMTLPLGEILPLLVDAVKSERTWLRDFENEEVTIPTDLYEVVLAYQHCRRPSA